MPVWLMKIGHGFSLFATWVKGNWGLLLAGAGLIFGLILLRRKTLGYDQLLNSFRDQQTQNRKQLEELRKIQQEQQVAQQAINTKYQEVIDRIQADYQDQLRTLDAKKAASLREIITTNHDDPYVMAREINSLLGIPLYIIPR